MVEHLVAGIQGRAEQDIKGFGHADGAEDLGLGIVFGAVVLGDVTGNLLAELLGAAVIRVRSASLLEGRDRSFADVVGRDEVGFADAEGHCVLHLGHDGKEVTDARFGQGRDMSRHETA